jgi:carbon-monoxide dehydrogenase medium subunit
MINPHPGLPEFEYLRFTSLAEASQFLVLHRGEARPFSGGTDCFVRMRDGHWKEKYLVDIKGLDGTNQLTFDPAQGLTIGAAVCMNQVAAFPAAIQHYPALVEAAQTVASYQLRTRATVVGNICNASPAGDTIGACLLYNGSLHIYGPKGTRIESLVGFFKGPGKNTLQAGDIVTAISLPIPPKGHTGCYLKLGRNAVGDLAIIGVTVLAYPDPLLASGYRFRVALASVAPVPLIVRQVETLLGGQAITPAAIELAAQAAMDACSPIDDVRGSARYRKYMVRNLTRQGLNKAWSKLH